MLRKGLGWFLVGLGCLTFWSWIDAPTSVRVFDPVTAPYVAQVHNHAMAHDRLVGLATGGAIALAGVIILATGRPSRRISAAPGTWPPARPGPDA